MNTILLVEDDPEITKLLNLHLQSDACHIKACVSCEDAIKEMTLNRFDLFILDVTLPGINGLELCKHIRESGITTPVMMLTCINEEADKVLALELGADDYVTKPFSILELKARTKALMRRGVQNKHEVGMESNLISCKELLIDIYKKKATIRGERLELTLKEFDLLLLLATNPGRSFSRNELLEQVWGFSFEGYKHTITSHINRLRIKIENNLHHPEYILTSWGTGYRFVE
jgi:DNA-binding response OmpR family regulator